jgi:hypothetical protein
MVRTVLVIYDNGAFSVTGSTKSGELGTFTAAALLQITL